MGQDVLFDLEEGRRGNGDAGGDEDNEHTSAATGLLSSLKKHLGHTRQETDRNETTLLQVPYGT